MTPRELPFPVRGVSDASAVILTPREFCPPGAMVNFWASEPGTNRIRGAKRAGLLRMFKIGTTPVQAIRAVTRASTVSGQKLGQSQTMSGGRSYGYTGLSGQVWGLDANYALDLMHHVDTSGSGPFGDTGPSGPTAIAACTSPDGRFLAVAFNYSTGSPGPTVARICLFDLLSNTLIRSIKLERTGGVVINTMRMSATRLYACVVTLGSPATTFVNVYSYVDTLLTRLSEWTHNVNGWGSEIVDIALSRDGAALFAAFNGNTTGRTLGSGAIVSAGENAKHFGSGVLKYLVSQTAPHLIPVAFSPQLAPTARFFEGSGTISHNYWRLSEQIPGRAPQGGIMTAIATCPDGGLVVAHTNTGRGPDSNTGSGDYRKPEGPLYSTVTKITAAGLLEWTADTDSIRESGDGGFLNDIPTPPDSTTDFASIQALVVDAAGDVYAAGRLNVNAAWGGSLFKLSGSDGAELWRVNLGGTVLQGALTLSPGARIAASGERNTGWVDSGGANALLWVIRQDTGEMVKGYDLGASASAPCVAATSDRLLFGTSKV